MGLTTYAGNFVLNGILRGQTMTPPTNLWLSLHTADPGKTGAHEVSTDDWPAYARTNVSGAGALADAFSEATEASSSNVNDLPWDGNDGDGDVTVGYWTLWDAATGGNPWFSGAFTAARTLSPTDELILHPGELTERVP